MNNTSLATYLASDPVKKNIENVLGRNVNQFITSVVSLVGANNKLAECDRQSLLAACITASSLNLPVNPNLGFAYIIPYKNNSTGITEAQFQVGYKGFIQLAQRSGEIRTINVSDVKQGELIALDRLTGEVNIDWKEDRENLATVGYISFFETIRGFRKSLYMTNDQISKHALKFSKTYKKGFGVWKDDFDNMAKKTVIKLLLSKYAPMTNELAIAIAKDQSIAKDDSIDYMDNIPDTPNEQAEEKENERIQTHIAKSDTIKDLLKVEVAVSGSKNKEIEKLYTEKLSKLYSHNEIH